MRLFIFFLGLLLIGCKSESQKSPAELEKTQKELLKNESENSKITSKSVKDEVNKELIEEKTPESKTFTPIKKESKEIVSENKKPNTKVSKQIVKKPRRKKSIKKGKFLFQNPVHDFGYIEMGDIVNYKFKFKNIGNKDINISNVVASCGCTQPVFPFLAIEPGDTGEIGVRFDSKGRLGSQEATITILSDAAEKELELRLKGVVRSKMEMSNTLQDSL